MRWNGNIKAICPLMKICPVFSWMKFSILKVSIYNLVIDMLDACDTTCETTILMRSMEQCKLAEAKFFFKSEFSAFVIFRSKLLHSLMTYCQLKRGNCPYLIENGADVTYARTHETSSKWIESWLKHARIPIEKLWFLLSLLLVAIEQNRMEWMKLRILSAILRS